MIVGARVETITQDDTSVSVSAVHDGERLTAKGQFLIGADGAHSVTRNALGFEFPGMTYPETTILATTTVDFFDLLPGLSNVNYVWAPQGTFSLLRLPDLWRCSLYPYPDETIEDALKPEAIEAKLQAIAPRDDPYPIGDVRPYRVHQRIVERYQSGRVFLAGDSAHVNSPSGGMGMNGGIHDAYVLTALMVEAWKSKDPAHLSSYTDRRRPIALSEILAQADRNRARMQERDPEKRRDMLKDLQKVTADPIAARAYLLKSSMIEGLRRAGL
jgi:3-(3-hydroxy-phenyl)propionate hydroxylase